MGIFSTQWKVETFKMDTLKDQKRVRLRGHSKVYHSPRGERVGRKDDKVRHRGKRVSAKESCHSFKNISFQKLHFDWLTSLNNTISSTFWCSSPTRYTFCVQNMHMHISAHSGLKVRILTCFQFRVCHFLNVIRGRGSKTKDDKVLHAGRGSKILILSHILFECPIWNTKAHYY